MKVLIAFVTKSDPYRDVKMGPALTVTAALALEPDKIYLLYNSKAADITKNTVDEFEKTKKFLVNDASFKKKKKISFTCPETNVIGIDLELSDVTDYCELKDKLPEILYRIGLQNRGYNFSLVGGLPQARMIFALCINSGVISGELLEAPQRPDDGETWPMRPADYRARLKALDFSVFSHFQDLLRKRLGQVRLSVNPEHKVITLDKNRMNFRGKEEQAPRALSFLVLLCANALYGNTGDAGLAGDFLNRYGIYTGDNRYVNVNNALKSINKLGQECTAGIQRLDELVCSKDGIFYLSDELRPFDQKVEILPDPSALYNFLTGDLKLTNAVIRASFPRLISLVQ